MQEAINLVENNYHKHVQNPYKVSKDLTWLTLTCMATIRELITQNVKAVGSRRLFTTNSAIQVYEYVGEESELFFRECKQWLPW